ncbi:hypothetical protein B0H17DRAFT_1102839 [Mycena rosella]|uniref:Uncharacterized protein n=1 Tax=Mycena rosella TaxID=1033263 RepID=A0AAD7CHA2_MYCRO|nr:hypothetical protein B0H17DRAFT_1102839 [Mycena rosella]
MSSMLALLRLRAPRLALHPSPSLSRRALSTAAPTTRRGTRGPVFAVLPIPRSMSRKEGALLTTRLRRPPRGAREEELHAAADLRRGARAQELPQPRPRAPRGDQVVHWLCSRARPALDN